MKFADTAWILYRNKFGLHDRDRARIEQENADWHAGFLATAQGDRTLALGMMTLATAQGIARDFGIPEAFILKHLIAKSPQPAQLKQAIRAARKGH